MEPSSFSLENITTLEELVDLVGLCPTVHRGGDENQYLHGDKKLIDIHGKNSNLFLEHYLKSSVVDGQTATLLNFNGIDESKYMAYLCGEGEGRFYRTICNDFESETLKGVEDDIKKGLSDFDYYSKLKKKNLRETFYPHIKGGRWNPYIRYKVTKSSASNQTTKMIDLASVNTFNSFVFTYPEWVSSQVYDNGIEWAKKKNAECFKLFFDALHELKDYDGKRLVKKNKRLACSLSFHPWSSKNPIKSHMHNHVVIPHVCVDVLSSSKNKEKRLLLEKELNSYYQGLEKLNHILDGFYNHRTCGFEGQQRLDLDIRLLEKQRDNLKERLEKKICDGMGIERLPWFYRTKMSCSGCGKTYFMEDIDDDDSSYCPSCGCIANIEKRYPVPFPVLPLKKLWTKCVNSVFAEIKFEDALDHDIDGSYYDVFVEYIFKGGKKGHIYKTKLLHIMKYKSRPAILDLDGFFKHNSGVLNMNYGSDSISLNIDLWNIKNKNVSHYLKGFDEKKIIDFLSNLCLSNTDTRVFGFWNYLSHYCLKRLADSYSRPCICPICGGYEYNMGFVSSLPSSCSLIIKNRRWFSHLKPPP